MGDMVMWTSSATRQFGGGYGDWLTPGQVAGLVRDRSVLPPTATSCTIPLEVRRDAPDFRVGSLNAYGPMEEFSYPPRPASGPWNLQWTARIRHRSTTGFLVGMEGFGAGPATSGEQEKAECKPKKKKGFGGLLGGAMAGALGVPDGSDDGC